ncbi:MAG: four helix bundle protein [Bacteroidota bacterium]|nr:four helix bundle protein [Bacteroidota bacterium]
MYQDIKERTFNFGLRIISLSGYLPGNNVGYTLGKQILRSGTSIGANVEEGVAAFSRADYA